MKKYGCLLTIFLFITSTLVFAENGKIEESYYIYSQSTLLKKNLISNHDLIIDHVSSKGFEIYGPKGLGEYLRNMNVNFVSLESLESPFIKANEEAYPSYEEVVNRIKSAVAKYSKIMKLFSVGKTVEGRDLWVVKISDNVNSDEVEPEFKYISSMHGDEIVGRELMQNLIEDIGVAYSSGDKQIVNLVNNAEIFIMPSMNPDGSEDKKRGNGNNVDLNRNFPDPFAALFSKEVNVLQPETMAIMKFEAERNFSLSANFHGGAVVFNYPWDAVIERHPMDSFLIDISLGYSKLNPVMWNSSEFKNGITNGADWYIVKGGMQDWSYLNYNDLQFTIELSDIKYPDFKEIPAFYQDNKESLITFMEKIFQGKGFYWKEQSDQSGQVEVFDARAKSLGKFPWHGGEFYKVLPAGNYVFNILDAKGNLLKKLDVEVGQNVLPNERTHYLL